MHLLDVPTDVFSYILDFVNDDPPSLMALRLTNRALENHCRHRLFSNIKLHRGTANSFKQLHKLDSTGLAVFTKAITISAWNLLDDLPDLIEYDQNFEKDAV